MEPLTIMRVRQGCLLSMLLCIIAMEVTFNFINTDKIIKGIQRGDHEIKIVNFDEDATTFLRDIFSLSIIRVILKLYQNAKMN